MIGPSPNPLILSYLKYAISSQVREAAQDCQVQLQILTDCHGKAEECISLCRALLAVAAWLLRAAAFYSEPGAGEPQLRVCVERLERLLHSPKNRALVHIGRLEEPASWANVEQAVIRVSENLNNLTNQTLRSKLEECVSLVKSIPAMLSLQADPPSRTLFPSVHALVMLEGTMNLTGETQPLVEQLMMVKRMQVRETDPEPPAAFPMVITFTTVQPLVEQLMMVKRMQDFTEDVNIAFEYLLKLTPLLDKADQRCNCDCISLLLQECSKLGLLSESNTANLISKREHSPRLKTSENANIQPNPGLILRAEPTVTNILKTVDADHSKSPEGLLGVLGHMLSGKSLDLLLAAAAATGKLKSFARKFIKWVNFSIIIIIIIIAVIRHISALTAMIKLFSKSLLLNRKD
ncbi:UNVERIFIED_CONTAM: hypothetical protein FKN15_051615 [Acipenser sinensis]